jgi:hypothetical protein
MAGAHATMWIACRMPDWLCFGNFNLVSKQIKMAGTARDQNSLVIFMPESKWIKTDRNDQNRLK